jgi:hypothetical protein
LSSNPVHAEVYSIQHYVISLSVTYDRSMVSSTSKTDRQDIAKVLLKAALKPTIKFISIVVQCTYFILTTDMRLCVMDDHRYVPFVVDTIPSSFPRLCLITLFLTWVTWLVPLVEQELLTYLYTEYQSSSFLWGSCCLLFYFLNHCLYICSLIWRLLIPFGIFFHFFLIL